MSVLGNIAAISAYCGIHGPDYWYNLSKDCGTSSRYRGSTCKKSRTKQNIGHKNKKLKSVRKHNKNAKKARKKQRGK